MVCENSVLYMFTLWTFYLNLMSLVDPSLSIISRCVISILFISRTPKLIQMFNFNVGPIGPQLYLSDTGNKQSNEVMNNLEKVDDYCDKLEISLVKINDLELVTEYNLGELPALVYYRHNIPILYEGMGTFILLLFNISFSAIIRSIN